MRKIALFISLAYGLFLFCLVASVVVPGAQLHLDASNNPGHQKSWKNIGLAGGELLAADDAPMLEKGTIKIPVLGITQAVTKYYIAKKALQTFGGPVDKNPELAVEDWTLEFLCKRNGGLLQEEHYFTGFQLVKSGCFVIFGSQFL